MGNQGSALITASPPEPRLRRPSQRPAPSRLPDRQASRSRPSCTFEVFRSSRSSPPTSFPRPPGCPPARRRLPFEVVKVPAGAQPAPQLAASPARRARRPETTTGSLGPAPQTIVVIARRTPITWHARGDAIAPSTGFSYTRPRQLRGSTRSFRPHWIRARFSPNSRKKRSLTRHSYKRAYLNGLVSQQNHRIGLLLSMTVSPRTHGVGSSSRTETGRGPGHAASEGPQCQLHAAPSFWLYRSSQRCSTQLFGWSQLKRPSRFRSAPACLGHRDHADEDNGLLDKTGASGY
jgi:hypothetical protein